MPIPWKWRLVVLGVFDHGTEFMQKKDRRKILLEKGDSAETVESARGYPFLQVRHEQDTTRRYDENPYASAGVGMKS